MKEKADIQIFLAHAKEDKGRVMQLYVKLKEAGYKPWLDKIDLIPGQNWKTVIPQEIERSDIFIAFLSKQSIGRQGYIQKEFRKALVEYGNRPPESIYLIPVRLDECEVPDLRQEEYGLNLRDIQWLDYWEEKGWERLLRAIEYAIRQKEGAGVDVVQKIEKKESRGKAASSLRLWVLSRRRLLQLLGLTVAGGGGIVMLSKVAQQVLDNQPTESLKAPSKAPSKGLSNVPNVKQEIRLMDSKVEYEVIKVNERGEEKERKRQQSHYFIEELAKGVRLEMREIKGGKFIMGSPSRERGHRDTERPQHEVNVASFRMGKFPITQAQWKAIASRTDLKVERDLDSDPSYFKGDNRPVENITWYDSLEFCARLSKLTGKAYTLPSEAQWEYACRAGTQTPFYLGETLTDQLANYRASDTYADEPKGQYREETTPVGSFPANAFGLYDLHGNVWEWCLDPWHGSYEGAPNDGSVWDGELSQDVYLNIDKNLAILLSDTRNHVVRGGSWIDVPVNCRSASRFISLPRIDGDYLGLRVVCSDRT